MSVKCLGWCHCQPPTHLWTLNSPPPQVRETRKCAFPQGSLTDSSWRTASFYWGFFLLLFFFFSFTIRSKPGKQVQEDGGTKEMGVPIFRNGSIPQSRATLKSLACPCSTSKAFPINSHNIILKWCFEFKNMLEITNKPFCLIPSLSSEDKGLPPGI